MTDQQLIRCVHLSTWIMVLCTAIFAFDPILLAVGIGLGWLLWYVGVSCSLHKWYAHHTFDPKNKVVEFFLLFFGTLCCLESHICWKVGHKLHHKYSGDDYDPFTGNSFWQKLKVAFYFHRLPADKEMGRVSLKKQPMVVWFHRYYYRVLAATFLVIWTLTGSNVGYFTAVPVAYVLCGYAWITTLAHSSLWEKIGSVSKELDDHSSDSHFWSIIFPGEGYHNTHHAYPGLWDNSKKAGGFDLTAPFIQLIGVPRS